jgi:uncharacterized protein (TIGR00255 family)
MTGYGRAEVSGPRVAALAEARSLNHRSLDVALRLPRLLSPWEAEARRLVQGALQRGRVEVTVTVTPVPGQAVAPVAVNPDQARAYAEAASRLAGELGVPPGLPVTWLLEQPGVLGREAEAALPPEEAWEVASQAMAQALGDLVARREAEGKALAQELGTLRETLAAQVEQMAARVPVALQRRAERLRERVRALLEEAPLDEGRLAMEVALLAERSDVSEELARLRAHQEQLTLLLAEGGPVGRTLDFLLQELHREVNTVGAKADDLDLSRLVIAAKATLEKIREQVQNLE